MGAPTLPLLPQPKPVNGEVFIDISSPRVPAALVPLSLTEQILSLAARPSFTVKLISIRSETGEPLLQHYGSLQR